MRWFSLAVFYIYSINISLADPVDPAKNINRFIGDWVTVEQTNGCLDHYSYSQDKTVSFTSGEQIGKASYVIYDDLSPNGSYQVFFIEVADNKKKDCLGNTSDVGYLSTEFVKFLSDDLMQLCDEDDSKNCFLIRREVANGS